MHSSTVKLHVQAVSPGMFQGRAGIAQRLLQPYRLSVYDIIANQCTGGLSVFASRFDHTNQIVTNRDPELAQLAPAKNRHFFRGRFDLCWQSGLLDWLRTWRPDVVIVEANPRNLSTGPMVRWLHKHGCRVIGHGLGVMPLSSGFERLRDIGRRYLIGMLDGVLAYSSVAAQQYEALGMPRKRIFVAYNAVSPKPKHPLIDRPMAFTRRPILLFVGTLIPRKSVDLLLQACAKVPFAIRPTLQIVGDGPLRPNLEQLATDLGLECLFLGDLRGPELDKIFEGADIFVLPGTGGLAIQEAMAHGLPVIVSKADGTESDLVRETNGWLITPNDTDVLAQAITQALSDPVRLRTMGADSYRIVSTEINIDNMAATFVHGMRTIAAMPPRTC